MTMITPSYLGETIEYSSLHACRSTLEDPTGRRASVDKYCWLSASLVMGSLNGWQSSSPMSHIVGRSKPILIASASNRILASGQHQASTSAVRTAIDALVAN